MAVQPWTSTEAAINENHTAEASQFALGVDAIQAGMIEHDCFDTARDNASFDPASGIDTSWDPSEFDTRYDDGGVWDSFNLDDDVITGVLDSQDVDFASFLNTEHIG
jgi:hypothetical protein